MSTPVSPLRNYIWKCSHTFTQSDDSILTFASSRGRLFAGTQAGYILIWDITKMKLIQAVKAHAGHILSLIASADANYLFAGGEGDYISVWDAQSEPLNLLFIIRVGCDSGNIHTLAFNESSGIIYVGCKNTAIQWFDIYRRHEIPREKIKLELEKSRISRFFIETSKVQLPFNENSVDHFIIFREMMNFTCHNGFVYALLIGKIPNLDHEILFSGSGDGTVKLWKINPGPPTLFKILTVSSGSVLALGLSEGLLYIGLQGGAVKVVDMETFQCIRTLSDHQDDVLSLVCFSSMLFTGSADGTIKIWNKTFDCVQTLFDHRGLILALHVTNHFLISGSNDKLAKVWEIPKTGRDTPEILIKTSEDLMIDELEAFVAIPTVSSDESLRESCRAGAKYLKALFKKFGADTRMIPGLEGKNPLVAAKFTSFVPDAATYLFYGHYDVQPASETGWTSPPFKLTGQNGYLYGRGVSDNKGPILATLFAVKELIEQKSLGINVYFLIEGEEECGSNGFYKAVETNKSFFGNINGIIISNSYWLGENKPCLTYGLRGVLHCTLSISSPNGCGDLHSGVDGGIADEPLIDMVKILGGLVDEHKQVTIPNFLNSVRPVNKEEEEMYVELAKNLSVPEPHHQIAIWKSKWRYPTFTIHKIDASRGSASNNTVIPGSVTATVSMRIVPDQEIEKVLSHFKSHVEFLFSSLKSRNILQIQSGHKADWWLASPKQCPLYHAASLSLLENWGIEPLYIREGGSIPAVPFLLKTFSAPVVHIPLGQASDNAHLPNERMRIENLVTGRRVMKSFFLQLMKQKELEHDNKD